METSADSQVTEGIDLITASGHVPLAWERLVVKPEAQGPNARNYHAVSHKQVKWRDVMPKSHKIQRKFMELALTLPSLARMMRPDLRQFDFFVKENFK